MNALMPAIKPAKLITSSSDLKQLATSLAQNSIIAVDTESNSLHAYQERVCLIQFTDSSGDSLVDPLAIEDLSLLSSIFADPNIEKIFHAAEYDLIVLHRDYEFEITNLFDTMVAARIIGRKKVGLGSLLEEEFQIRLAKKYQRADWGKRPLIPDMLEYARMDTHHLVELRNKLESELQRLGRWELAQEDFARLPKVSIEPRVSKEAPLWRIKGVRDLHPHEVPILNELSNFRDTQARKADQPLFKIIGDKTLVAIAALRPIRLQDLEEVKGMTPGQIRRFGKGLLAAVQRGAQAEPMRRPRRERYDPDFSDRLEVLRKWRKESAQKIEVESDVVLPRDVMESIARANPANVNAVETILVDLPWRQKKYSADIFQALHN
jgi:ribonuclease D